MAAPTRKECIEIFECARRTTRSEEEFDIKVESMYPPNKLLTGKKKYQIWDELLRHYKEDIRRIQSFKKGELLGD